MTENEIGTIVLAAAQHIHKELGPGLLESIYEACMFHELQKRGLSVRRQVHIDIHYDTIVLLKGFRADLIVENKVLLELKSTETSHPIFKKQCLTYLKLTKLHLGYVLNFGLDTMKEGTSRVVWGLDEDVNVYRQFTRLIAGCMSLLLFWKH